MAENRRIPAIDRHLSLGVPRSDPCEWNPKTNAFAYEDEVHARAELIVGANGQVRLCRSCAALPRFKRYRKRKEIVR